jgi:hypothetical protein
VSSRAKPPKPLKQANPAHKDPRHFTLALPHYALTHYGFAGKTAFAD